MDYIENLQIELDNLNDNIKKTTEFFHSEFEVPKFTDEFVRIKLACQIEYMIGYKEMLEQILIHQTQEK